jgi:hypothetical protein
VADFLSLPTLGHQLYALLTAHAEFARMGYALASMRRALERASPPEREAVREPSRDVGNSTPNFGLGSSRSFKR